MDGIEALADRGAFLWRCSCCAQAQATPDKPRRRVCPTCLLQQRREQQRDHARRVRGTDLSPRACSCCGQVFTPARSDARCCSAKCRAKLSRQAKAKDHPAPKRFHVSSLLMENPPNSKRVTRPSRWGNPFRVGVEASTAAEAVALFRDHLAQHPELVELARRELRGFDLGCTCPLDQPCHADVWLQVVNS